MDSQKSGKTAELGNKPEIQPEKKEDSGEKNDGQKPGEKAQGEELIANEEKEEEQEFVPKPREKSKSPEILLLQKMAKAGVLGEITEEGEFVKLFLDRERILNNPELVRFCGQYLAFPFRYEVSRKRVTAVVSLTVSGFLYASHVALELFELRSILPYIYCADSEKFSRDIDGVKGGNVLVIEDVLDESLMEKFGRVKEIVEGGGGHVVGLSALFYDPVIAKNSLSELVIAPLEIGGELWNRITYPSVPKIILKYKKETSKPKKRFAGLGGIFRRKKKPK